MQTTPTRRLNLSKKRKKTASKSNNEPPPSAAKRRRTVRRKQEGLDFFCFKDMVLPTFAGTGELVGRPFYPLSSSEMPLPGPDFLELAQHLGDNTEMKGKPGTKGWCFAEDDSGRPRVGQILEQLLCEALYSPGTFQLPMTVKGGQKRTMTVVSGHPWSRGKEMPGPCPCDVLVLGKCLGEEETRIGACYVGPTGHLLADTCAKLGLHPHGWYMTNVLKTEQPEDRSGELKKPWVREFLPLLQQELRIVRPRYILCLGADASKTLFGRHASLKSMEGRVVEYTYPVHFGERSELTHTAYVMCVTHPAAVLRAPERTEQFEMGIARFGQLVAGHRWDQEEVGLEHFNVDTLEALRELELRIAAECQDNLIAVDAEWHGEHPQNEGSYVRTVQLSWREKTAACVILRGQGGALRMRRVSCEPEERYQDTAISILNRIAKGRRIAGHFLNSDLEWLEALGLHLTEQFAVPDTWEETMRLSHEDVPQGGFDTGIAGHAVDETADLALTSMALRFTSAPRYDYVLDGWKQRYCNENKLKKEELEGFGECPDDVLHPEPGSEHPHYACYDADIVWRMTRPLQSLLDRDRYGNNCWEPFWMTMRALPAILEMNTTGIPVDRQRLEDLTLLYRETRARLEKEIREWARWPALNLQSVFQVRELLFGEEYNGKEREHPEAPPVRLRPPGARTMRLEPVITTDKHPRPWNTLSQEERRAKTPSTKVMVLSILAQEATKLRRLVGGEWRTLNLSKHVTKLRDFRFVGQVMRSVLRNPKTDDEGKLERDEDGHYIYPGGLPAAICDDGRVRSHGYPTKETGRWSFSRPPMQNFAKRREADYKRILGKQYRWPLRTMLRAPEGKVMVEADYKGAELYGMALMSGDEQMIEHAKRNLLAEYHPRFYDIHSSVAVAAFGYDCPPTKGGLKSIGKKHMRIVAKAVIFGVAYGRGAKAIALAAKEEGVEITEGEAQQVIDAIFSLYPGLVPFFDSCRSRVGTPRWMCDAFGRFRRFPVTRDRGAYAEFERQAMNFPIQALVANAVARAVDHLYHYRDDYEAPREELYDLVLQVHDAIVSLLIPQNVPWFLDEVLPYCMTDMVPIYPCDLDGIPDTSSAPHYLGIDMEVMIHWGEKLTPGQCKELGFSPKYGGWHKTDLGWVDVEDESRIWRRGDFVKPKDGEFAAALQELADALE